MFNPNTKKIQIISELEPKKIEELEKLLLGNINMYIDYANVRNWVNQTKWHIDLKRLKQFLNSFDNIKSIKFYQGTLVGDTQSEAEIKQVKNLGYDLKTKNVKIMRHSIDVSSIKEDSTDLIAQFMRRSLIKKLDVDSIIYLNKKFSNMNKLGIFCIEDRKCNFDVEIGRDILVDFKENNVDTYILWSGDSDFADPIEQLLTDGKSVVLFCTARRVSTELNLLRDKGLIIFDINKLKNFISRNSEISDEFKILIKSKEESN